MQTLGTCFRTLHQKTTNIRLTHPKPPTTTYVDCLPPRLPPRLCVCKSARTSIGVARLLHVLRISRVCLSALVRRSRPTHRMIMRFTHTRDENYATMFQERSLERYMSSKQLYRERRRRITTERNKSMGHACIHAHVVPHNVTASPGTKFSGHNIPAYNCQR